MATAREIKQRIKSIKNISQMTSAMQAVAASKVRRAQAKVMAGRPFSRWAWRLLLNIASQTAKGELLHPLLEVRDPVKQVLVIVITSDRGLAGAYNTNMFRTITQFEQEIAVPVSYLAVGRKGRDNLIRRGADLLAEFGQQDDPGVNDISPIARIAMDQFLSGQADEVYVAYTDFINTLTQKPNVLRLLPFKPFGEQDEMVMADSLMVEDEAGDLMPPQPSAHQLEYIYEPSAAAIFDLVLPRFTEVMVYHAILEAQASEHSARMVAMQNASDNAEDLVDDLTLTYNKARQLAVTNEMLDIVGGAEALAESNR